MRVLHINCNYVGTVLYRKRRKYEKHRVFSSYYE